MSDAATIPAKSPAPIPRSSSLARWWQRSGVLTLLRVGSISAFFIAWEAGSQLGFLNPLFA